MTGYDSVQSSLIVPASDVNETVSHLRQHKSTQGRRERQLEKINKKHFKAGAFLKYLL